MPTRISAGVGDHPCFLTFYNFDPYRLQNYSFFPLYLLTFGVPRINEVVWWMGAWYELHALKVQCYYASLGG